MSNYRDDYPFTNWVIDHPFLAYLLLLVITSSVVTGLALLLMHWTS